MNRLFVILTLVFLNINLSAQASSWDIFEKCTWRDEYVEEYFSYATLLEYNDFVKNLEGKEMEINGFYIPVMDEEVIILSKYPYANCFFCGGAGLESVVEIRLNSDPPRKFELDEKLKFKGRLKVNTTEWEFVSFILENATIIE